MSLETVKRPRAVEMMDDWAESREEAYEQTLVLWNLISSIKDIYNQANPTMCALLQLKEDLDAFELPIIDNFPNIVDNLFVSKWIYIFNNDLEGTQED